MYPVLLGGSCVSCTMLDALAVDAILGAARLLGVRSGMSGRLEPCDLPPTLVPPPSCVTG